jgi:hypothetical protein
MFINSVMFDYCVSLALLPFTVLVVKKTGGTRNNHFRGP